MPKDDSLYLGHMLDTSRKIMGKTQGLDRAGFDSDENLRIALTHLIQMIGEAARRVSPELRQANPQIPWRDVIGMRHKVVHDYMDIDEDVVWSTATKEVPVLASMLEQLPPDEH